MARHSCPDAILIPSLRQQAADDEQFLHALGELFVQGVAIDWNAVYPKQTYRPLHLPAYPFQRQRFWVDSNRELPSAPSSRLVTLLQSGNADALAQYLQTQQALSADELKLLPKLSGLLIRQHRDANANTDGLCYRPIWQQQARNAEPAIPPAGAQNRPWLIFSAGDESELAQSLQNLGQPCIRVAPGNAYAQTAADTWTVTADNADDYRRLLEATQPQIIVYIWPSELTAHYGEDQLMQTILLTRAAAGLQAPIKLWLITRDASNAGDRAPSSPFPSLLSGLGRSLFLEYPNLKAA